MGWFELLSILAFVENRRKKKQTPLILWSKPGKSWILVDKSSLSYTNNGTFQIVIDYHSTWIESILAIYPLLHAQQRQLIRSSPVITTKRVSIYIYSYIDHPFTKSKTNFIRLIKALVNFQQFRRHYIYFTVVAFIWKLFGGYLFQLFKKIQKVVGVLCVLL
jgi:hypothetical protein